MDDLISRESLLKKFSYANADSEFDREWIPQARRWIKNEPTIEAVPVVHGEWILEEKAGNDYWCCSRCHKIKSEYYAKPKDNFCPNCGADMRKKVKQ